MRTFRKWLGRVLLLLVILGAGLWAFGPRENVAFDFNFDPTAFGGDLDAYFASQEGRFDDITPGTKKRVLWAGTPGERTPISLVYLHGFSASAPEMRPVHEMLAQSLGANLVFTRLTGHGRGSAAMTIGNAETWSRDTAEAIRAAQAIGDEVIVLSLSTGGTLAAAAALDPDLMASVKGIVFISPNLGINNALEPLFTWPAARYWLPVLAGRTRSWEPANEDQGTYWTSSYPSVSILPMAAMVKDVAGFDYTVVTTPALFYFSPNDKVVRPEETARVAAQWGQASQGDLAQIYQPDLTPDDDEYAHNVVGDILSPNQTEPALNVMLNWIAGLE